MNKIITLDLGKIHRRLIEAGLWTNAISPAMIIETMIRCSNEYKVKGYDIFTQYLLDLFDAGYDKKINIFLINSAAEYYGITNNFIAINDSYDLVKVEVLTGGVGQSCQAFLTLRSK